MLQQLEQQRRALAHAQQRRRAPEDVHHDFEAARLAHDVGDGELALGVELLAALLVELIDDRLGGLAIEALQPVDDDHGAVALRVALRGRRARPHVLIHGAHRQVELDD